MTPRTSALLGTILAGGASRRMGAPKAFIEIDGVPIVERVRRVLGAVFAECVVVTNEPAAYARLGIPVLEDRIRGIGPLGGLHAALLHAREVGATAICTAPCDAPFVSPGLYRRLVGSASPAAVLLPRSDRPRGHEPLFGRYAVSVVGPLERAIDRGVRSVSHFVESLAGDLELLDPPPGESWGRCFFNVNTPADLEAANRLLNTGTIHEG